MSTFIQTTTGEPVWIDLFSSDPIVASRFYANLFGWTPREGGSELGGYINFFLDDKQIAGMMPNNTNGVVPDFWTVYLNIDNADATAHIIAETGGLVQINHRVHDLGTMVVATDPSGATVGGWQAGTHVGFDEVQAPGTPAWFELQTKDYPSAVSFYQEAFGWNTSIMSDSDDFRYCTLGVRENAKAGIMDGQQFLLDDDSSQWLVYFSVASTDASAARVVELGGTIVDRIRDTPFGRMVTVLDPLGAAFKLIQPQR